MSELTTEAVQVLVEGDRRDREAMARSLDLSPARLEGLELTGALLPLAPSERAQARQMALVTGVAGGSVVMTAAIGALLVLGLSADSGMGGLVLVAALFAAPFLVMGVALALVMQRSRGQNARDLARRQQASRTLEREAFVLRDERGRLSNRELPRQALERALGELEELDRFLAELPEQVAAAEALFEELARVPGASRGQGPPLRAVQQRGERLWTRVQALQLRGRALLEKLEGLDQGRLELGGFLDAVEACRRQGQEVARLVGVDRHRPVRGSRE